MSLYKTIRNRSLTAGLAFVLFSPNLLGQANSISLKQAVDSLVQRSPAMEAASLVVLQQRAIQKKAFNLPNPAILAESPTGLFYTPGIQQNLEFPAVYFKQHSLYKEQTKLTETQRKLTKSELEWQFKDLFTEWQLAGSALVVLKQQDSLYTSIADASARQFEAGQIDKLEKLFAETKAADIHNQLSQAEFDYSKVEEQVRLVTGYSGEMVPEKLEKRKISIENFQLSTTNLSSEYYAQLEKISERQLALERTKALPGLMFGYMNQGDRNTEIKYRFSAGITIPLWFWQYRGGISSAKIAVSVANKEKESNQLQQGNLYQGAKSNLLKYEQALVYYEQQGIPQANEITNLAYRLLNSGETDYINFLRTINEALLIRLKYLETLSNYNRSIFQLEYITSQP